MMLLFPVQKNTMSGMVSMIVIGSIHPKCRSVSCDVMTLLSDVLKRQVSGQIPA